MWGDQEFYQTENSGSESKFQGAGGFLNSSQIPGASDKKGGAQRAQNVVPVTIRDILDSNSDKPVIEGTEAQMVTFVGRVLKVETKATNFSYLIEDDTGSVDVVQWVEGDADVDPRDRVIEDIYCRVVGSVRQSQGKQHVMAFKVSALTNLNELTSHLLEIQYVRVKLREINAKTGGGSFMGSADSKPVTSNSNANSNTNTAVTVGTVPGLNTHQNLVYSIIQSSTAESGINKNTLYGQVRGKMSAREVDNALEFLCGEGHIYSTIDEDHYKSTDSY